MVGADKKSSRAEDFARYKQYDYMAVRFKLSYEVFIDTIVCLSVPCCVWDGDF